MYFFGPYAPSSTGTSSMINTSKAAGSVAISAYGATPVTSTENGMKFSPDLETILSSLTWVSSRDSWRNASGFNNQVQILCWD
jgi:hypothetical protein